MSGGKTHTREKVGLSTMAGQTTSRTERAAKGALVSFLQYGVQMVLQAFLAPLVLRMAGQETLGAYAFLMQVVGYLAMLDLGISVSLNVFMAKAFGHDDGGDRLRAILSTARTYLCVSNGVIALMLIALSATVENFFTFSPRIDLPVRQSLVLLAVWQMAKAPWSVYGVGLNATQNLAAVNFIGIIGNVARLIFSLGLVVSGLGLVGMMLGNVIAEALSCFLAAVRFRRLYPAYRPVWGIPDKALFREMLVFGLQSSLINAAWRLVYLSDNIVVGYLYGAAAVSVYYSTQMPTTIAFNIVNRVHDSASPALNELQARREDDKVRNAFLRLHRLNFLLALPLAAGVCLLNGSLITLWVGKGQYGGDLMTMALAAFIVLTTVNHLTFIYFIASGRILYFGLVGLLEGMINLGLSIWLGKVIGLAGVMLASVIANIPATASVLYMSMRGLKIGVPEYLRSCIIRVLPPTVIGYAAGHLTGKLFSDNGWMRFIAQGGVLLAVYAASTYLLALTNEERTWVGSRLNRLARFRGAVNAGGTG